MPKLVLTEFPALVWRSPLAVAIDDRGRSELAASGRILSLRAGERVFAEGDAADSVIVVIRGAVHLRGLQGKELRRALPGELFGLEATFRAGGERLASAEAASECEIAELPAHVFVRALERSARGSARDTVLAARRAALRRATLDALGASPLGAILDESRLGPVLDAARHIELRRGDVLVERGDPGEQAFVVVAGFVRIEGGGGGHVTRGGIVAAAADRYGFGARASSPAEVLSIPRAFLSELASGSPRLAALLQPAIRGQAAVAGTEGLADPFRIVTARSLLVIDSAVCVRCGHCAASCADSHADGVSRLLRHGERVALPLVREALLPTSCQHCRTPACLGECPTGAIDRDENGDVRIREELCTGCGACAKACPWGNVELSPRRTDAGRGTGSPLVAVKCDLCRGRSEGPACVASCPVGAVFRIDSGALAHAGKGARRDATLPLGYAPSAAPAGPAIMGAGALVGAAFVASNMGVPRDVRGGALALGLMVVLAAYSVIKRKLPVVLRPHLFVHLFLGGLLPFVVVLHAGGGMRGLGGAAAITLVGSAVLGAIGAFAYAALPGRIAPLESEGLLYEEIVTRLSELDGALFRLLTKRSDATKRLYELILAPYRDSWLTPWRLLVLGARDEEGRLTRTIERVVEGRLSSIPGIDELVRAALEKPRLRAQRVGLLLLRGWFVPHVVAAVIALAFAVVHAVSVVWVRR